MSDQSHFVELLAEAQTEAEARELEEGLLVQTDNGLMEGDPEEQPES